MLSVPALRGSAANRSAGWFDLLKRREAFGLRVLLVAMRAAEKPEGRQKLGLPGLPTACVMRAVWFVLGRIGGFLATPK